MTPTRKQLLSIEWAGYSTTGDLACPVCRGGWPQAEGHFVHGIKSRRPGVVYGHKPDCWLAACLAASPPEPQAWCETFVPMTHFGQPTGDDACNDCGLPAARHPVATQEYERGYLDACADHIAREDAGKANVTLGTAGSNLNVLWFKDSNGTVWTREPRR